MHFLLLFCFCLGRLCVPLVTVPALHCVIPRAALSEITADPLVSLGFLSRENDEILHGDAAGLRSMLRVEKQMVC